MNSRYKYIKCRLCLFKSECLSDIFEDNGRQGFTAADVIIDLLQFKVSKTDGYPQLVCLDCMDKLIEFKNFKQQCENAKSKFEKDVQSERVFINSENFSKSNVICSDVAAPNSQRFGGCRNESNNGTANAYDEKEFYNEEKDASKFCDVVVKTEVEEFCSVKEETQENEKILDEPLIPCTVEIKEEELIISNSNEENLSAIPFQFDATLQRGNKIFECCECHEKFFQKRKFNAHMKRHREEKGYPCEVCGKKFKLNGCLTEHKRIHSGEKPYRCKFCGKCFTHSSSHRKHVIRVHNEKQFQCEWCPQKFSKNETLISHVKIHSRGKPFECDRCDKRFGFAASLAKHKLLHSGEVPFECNECRRTFDHKEKLRKHVRYHSKERLFGCDVCEKRFLQKCGLIDHMTLHSGERPYMCEECGKKFRKKTNLTVHKRVHSGERPFHCDKCDKKFTQKGSLNSHRKLHGT